MKKIDIKETVREKYGEIAKSGGCCCSGGCCGGVATVEDIAGKIGYSDDEIQNVPEGSNLGLGCGNPNAYADISEGETVVDLGSGAGFDCFIAARRTGETGRVIGIDMTPEMVEKARKNAISQNINNVEFRLGEIENMPVEDNTAHIIISNCVINLSPDKEKAFREAYRIMKPGGRLFVTDMVLYEELPDHIRDSINSYIGCIAGALLKEDYLEAIKKAGFIDIQIEKESPLPTESVERTGVSADVSSSACQFAASIMVTAKKPERSSNVKKIEILGAGCPSCKKLYELTKQAVDESGIECEVSKVEDIMKIMEYEVLSTPALVVDGQVKAAGRLPGIEEIRKMIS